MAAPRLLYFTAEDRYLYRPTVSGLELEARFSGDEPGASAFRDHLRGARAGLFAILADLTGEDFHEEQIPLLRASDRHAVVQRRLAQRYRDTRLAMALSLGTVVTPERRNERLLLTSFTNTQQLAPWLEVLEEAGARLAGVYSVPLLAPALAARLGIGKERALIVTANRAGLRQCYVDQGKLRFARLERTVDMVPQALAMFVRSETQRLAQYLVTLRALPRDGAPVQVIVVAPAGQRAAFEQALQSDARLLFRTVDHHEALKALRLRRVPESAGAEAFYLHLAARKPPREQFASREDRRGYFIWQLQRGIAAAGALGFAACALYGGTQWLATERVQGQAAFERREARLAAEQYERITATFPVTQTSTENLKIAVQEFMRIAARSAPPEESLVHVSRVLEQFPQMQLDALVWSVGRPGDVGEASRAEKPGELAVLVQLSGRVNATLRNDYRGITGQVQEFAAALGMSGYELVRTQLPFDVTSEGTLTGDMGARRDSGEAPRFTIVVARRLQ